jgi:hypothetical protein
MQPRDHISTGSHCYLNRLCPMILTFVTFNPYTTSEGYSLSLPAILFVQAIVSIYLGSLHISIGQCRAVTRHEEVPWRALRRSCLCTVLVIPVRTTFRHLGYRLSTQERNRPLSLLVYKRTHSGKPCNIEHRYCQISKNLDRPISYI